MIRRYQRGPRSSRGLVRAPLPKTVRAERQIAELERQIAALKEAAARTIDIDTIAIAELFARLREQPRGTTGETMTRTIRLTDGPPVRIDDDEWPSVAWASDEVDHTPKAKRSGWVRVRRHADGRHIVYSGSRSTNPREGNLEAGWVVPAADRRRLDQYIEAAAEAIGWPTLAASCSKSLLNRLITEAEEALFATLDADCIADLPPAEDDEDDDGQAAGEGLEPGANHEVRACGSSPTGSRSA